MGVAVAGFIRQTVILERIDAREELLGVFGTVEDGVSGHVATRCLLQERVAEIYLFGAGSHGDGKDYGQASDDRMISHSVVCFLLMVC